MTGRIAGSGGDQAEVAGGVVAVVEAGEIAEGGKQGAGDAEVAARKGHQQLELGIVEGEGGEPSARNGGRADSCGPGISSASVRRLAAAWRSNGSPMLGDRGSILGRACKIGGWCRSWAIALPLFGLIGCIHQGTKADNPGKGGPTRAVWLDPTTNLMWAGSDNGKDISWQGAMNFCRRSRLAEFNDWRLATVTELEGIYDLHASCSVGSGPVKAGHLRGA